HFRLLIRRVNSTHHATNPCCVVRGPFGEAPQETANPAKPYVLSGFLSLRLNLAPKAVGVLSLAAGSDFLPGDYSSPDQHHSPTYESERVALRYRRNASRAVRSGNTYCTPAAGAS